MAVNSPFPSQLAFYQESTQGTPPANGAEWASSGKRIRHIGDDLDISGIAQAAVDDMRSQIHVDAVNLKAKGLKNTEFSFSIYLTGYGSKIESGSSNTEIDMGTLLKHALGGQVLGTSLTASGTHSTTTVEVADASSLEVGQYIGIEQGGVVYPRRIIDISDDVITYDEATPAAPQNDDIVRAFVTHYIDEEVLIDSAAGPYTFSWLIQKGLGSAGFDTVQLQGCKAALTGIEVSRGELAKLTFTVQAASFTDDRDAPNPEWVGSPTGNAPVVVGPDTTIFLQDKGTTTSNSIKGNVSVEVGVPGNVPYQTGTEAESNMEGVGGYTYQPADTLISISLAGFDNSYLDDWESGTFKTFRWAKLGPAGSVCGFAAHKAEVLPPTWGADVVNMTNIQLRAHRDDPNGDANTDALWESKLVIFYG